MPNRDHGDSYYDRSQGRFGSREERAYGAANQAADSRISDWESRYQSRGQPRNERSPGDTLPGYGQARNTQRYDQQRYESPRRTQGYSQADFEYAQSSYAPEWRSHAQDWRDNTDLESRSSTPRTWARAEGYAQQRTDLGHRHESVFGEQEAIRQEWDRSLGRSYSPNSGGYRQAQFAPEHDHETIGQQLRHASHQVVNRVKRAFRGPKGYKRSDERILEDVNERFASQDRLDPSEIEVRVSGGEVTLTGTVHSRWDKFAAEELADDVSGVEEVHNQLRVRRADGTVSAADRSGTSSTQAESPVGNRNIRA